MKQQRKNTIYRQNYDNLARDCSDVFLKLVKISFYTKAITILNKDKLTEFEIKFLDSIAYEWAYGFKYPQDWTALQVSTIYKIYYNQLDHGFIKENT